MIKFNWHESKNEILKRDRNISFEDVVEAINDWWLIDTVSNLSKTNHWWQKSYLVKINNFVYVVPFDRRKNWTSFLRTVIPNGKLTRKLLS